MAKLGPPFRKQRGWAIIDIYLNLHLLNRLQWFYYIV
jgi:hypothetical protein